MFVWHNIASVAKYESKLLRRSWFYRVFLVLIIFFICIYNFVALISENSAGFWLLKALPSNIPYINLMLLNTGQAIIAVFLSSEFLKSDKKLDTSEVFYVHPLSNAEYVIGKILGNAIVFLRLDVFMMIFVVAFNIMSGVSIDWLAYIVYFLLICIPTLIYIFGLSIGLMLFLKNQAITFVLLLGYIALTLFYIGDKFYYLFDYMVYNLPLVKSTIIGFSNWDVLINHRMIYFLLGIGFICISIFLFRRLPNSNVGKYRWLTFALIFIFLGVFASYKHISNIKTDSYLRQLYTEINNQYVNMPKIVVDNYNIDLHQHAKTISSEVEMSGVVLDRASIFAFCLNPGFTVTRVVENEQALSYERDHQILLIDFGRELKKGDSIRFTLNYKGVLDETFSYLDIPSEVLEDEFASGMFKIDKKYSFQQENYILFTPETYWYPRPGTSYSNENPDWQQAYFSNFRLKVTTINDLIAISQGTMKWPIAKRDTIKYNEVGNERGQLNSEGGRRFSRSFARDSINTFNRDTIRAFNRDSIRRSRNNRNDLVVSGEGRQTRMNRGEGLPHAEGRGRSAGDGSVGEGRRERPNRERSANIDTTTLEINSGTSGENNKTRIIPNVTYEVAYDSVFIYETDFLTPYITLIIGDYEQRSIEVDETNFSIWYLKGHDYFSSVFNSIVDTIPAQIRERRRSIETTYSLDYSFKRFSIVEVPVQFYSYARTWTQAQEVMQPEMVLFPEMGSLINVANVVEAAKNEKNMGQRNGQEISDEDAALRVLNRFFRFFERTEANLDWSSQRGALNVSRKSNQFFVFPQLYNFRYNIFSAEWPISNRLIELYLQDKSDNHNWMRQMNGISNNEKANLLMEQKSFRELLSDVEHRDLLDDVTSLKANELFAYAEMNVGYKEFRDSLRSVLKRNMFTNLRFEDLLDTLGIIADVNIHPILNSWSYPTDLPDYVMATPEVTQITNRDGETFVVKIQVTNDSDYDGVINVEISFGGGQSAIYDSRANRKVSLKARESKMLVSVWDEAPRSININSLISGNLPSSISLPVNNIIRERNRPVDKEGDFIIENVSYTIPGEIIVDNEDSTLFFLSAPEVVGLLPQWLDKVDDNSFRYSGVSSWRPPLQWTLTTNDKYYGMRIRSAYVIKSGSGTQSATWKIPVPDEGQYDLYYFVYKPDELRRGRGRGGRGRSRTTGEAEYHFKVRYNDDEESAYIDLQRSDEGWSLLGTYFFNNDTVEVILSDETKLRTVTADAVKIVRR